MEKSQDGFKALEKKTKRNISLDDRISQSKPPKKVIKRGSIVLDKSRSNNPINNLNSLWSDKKTGDIATMLRSLGRLDTNEDKKFEFELSS